MGSKDRGTKEVRKPKTAKGKKEKATPVIPTRVKPRHDEQSPEKE
jgi:hypothetical protein